MSLSAKEQCLAQEMIDLKARVKAEMQRRCRKGSLTAYAGTDYDYTVTPVTGGRMLTEHVNKIIVPMNAITASGMTERVVGDQAVAMDVMDAKLTAYSAEPMQRNATSSCSGACSGLCVGGCWNSCSGCGGSCSSNCSGSCDTDCTTNCGTDGCSSCTGSCSGSCKSGCKGSCTDQCEGCGGTCADTCSVNCKDVCTGSCKGDCNNTCTGTCKGGSTW